MRRYVQDEPVLWLVIAIGVLGILFMLTSSGCVTPRDAEQAIRHAKQANQTEDVTDCLERSPKHRGRLARVMIVDLTKAAIRLPIDNPRDTGLGLTSAALAELLRRKIKDRRANGKAGNHDTKPTDS